MIQSELSIRPGNRAICSLPPIKGTLAWAPNQNSFLEHDPAAKKAYVLPTDTLQRKEVIKGKSLSSPPSFFPDGRGFAYTFKRGGRSILAIEQYDDPLGDIVNLWEFPYSGSQKAKLAKDHLIFLESDHEQIYTLYEKESYWGTDMHQRPFLVTSDAVLETFYAAFSALLSYVERIEFKNDIEEFAARGLEVSREEKASADVEDFFSIGLILCSPEKAQGASGRVLEEVARIQHASGTGKSLFGKEISYDDFFIRGKYERDRDLQGYFRALKWFGVFKFDLNEKEERKWVSDLMEVVGSSEVYPSIERINTILKDIIGEPRQYSPLTLKGWRPGDELPKMASDLPWIRPTDSFSLLPSLYTLDAFIFDELVTHSNKADAVGTVTNPRLLPRGMDIAAAFGSDEAKRVLLNEFNEGQTLNYEKKLDEVAGRIKSFPRKAWDQNIYQKWLEMLKVLQSDPPKESPGFARSRAWKRKQLNTALGSWVNLRYETAAYVEQVSAEAGESGYERIHIGKPRGYVEPNPEFFSRLNEGFGKISDRFGQVIGDTALRKAVTDRIQKYRKHLETLETIAQKELRNETIRDEEYREILYIGRTIEHFILIISSLSSLQGEAHSLSNPDSIRKVVDIQKSLVDETRAYEALGFANEVNVAVPFYGRRQIVKGPVYSYYEFRSSEKWDNVRWRASDSYRLPPWIADYYEGKSQSEPPDSVAALPKP